MRQIDEQSKVFYELSAVILNILRSPPPPIDFSDESSSPVRIHGGRGGGGGGIQQITPIGFASLLLGISLALMLCGSVTFFIGFMLMPWVICLAMIFSVVGFVSSLSMIGRSILYPTPTLPSSPTNNWSTCKIL